MAICSSCRKEYIAETVLERAATDLLPSGLELYDFGGGCVVVPIPDIRRDGVKNLASHMAALVEMPCDSHTTKMLVFEIREATWQRSTGDFAETIVADLKRALSLWETKAVNWDNGNFSEPV